MEEGEEDEEGAPVDPDRMKRTLAKRFPGLRSIDFVRVLIAPEERSGTCWTETSRPWETEIGIEYAIDGETRSASGIAELKSQGWWPTYRAPEGFGFERRASFDVLDVKLVAKFTCRCVGGPGVKDTEWLPLDLRFRWKKGKMPEVSAAVAESGTRRGLTPSSVYGHLLTYDFHVMGVFPAKSPARCGVHATVAILNDPPIL